MLTRCPNPTCLLEFEIPQVSPLSAPIDKRGHYSGSCPQCGQVAAFRSAEAEAVIEREFEKRKARGALQGGPDLSPDRISPYSVLVEDVRSLWNVGSIFRTSDGAGFKRIFL